MAYVPMTSREQKLSGGPKGMLRVPQRAKSFAQAQAKAENSLAVWVDKEQVRARMAALRKAKSRRTRPRVAKHSRKGGDESQVRYAQ